MSGIAANGSAVASYRYDANGNTLQKTLGNGTVTAFTYDTANELLGVAHQRGGAAFDSLGYTYNSVGNRTARSEALLGGAAVTDGYGYDAIDQVTSVAYGSGRNVGYAYDAAGNRTSMSDNGNTTTYAANNLNQYSAISGTAPTYDANGNLTASGSWSYGYDAQNRMVAASSGTGGVSAAFAYDPRNRCVSRTINGATTFYTYDRWTLIQEQNSTGELARYISGPRTDEMLAMVSGTTTAYYHQDGLGSTVSLTDSTGNLIETCAYDVYGLPSFKTASGAPQSASTIGNRFLFTGREWISQVNLYDYRNRVYSQDLGRFEQVDPIRFAAINRINEFSHDPLYVVGPLPPGKAEYPATALDKSQYNLCRYVENNPTNFFDPEGLISGAGQLENPNFPRSKCNPNCSKFECYARCSILVGSLRVCSLIPNPVLQWACISASAFAQKSCWDSCASCTKP